MKIWSFGLAAILTIFNIEEIKTLTLQGGNRSMNELARQLAENRSAFFSHSFNFSWWLRGGEPGSPSDKLVLEGHHGLVSVTYMRARFDIEHEPPNHSETFHGKTDLDRASVILQDLFSGPLFREQQLKDESDRSMRDIRKETWTFDRGEEHYEKTLSVPFPKSLDRLRMLVHELHQRLATPK